MANFGRFVLIGCGGLVVLVVALVVVVAALGSGGGGGSQTAGSGSAEEVEDQPGATKANAVAIGEPVKAGKVEWTVVTAREATSLKSSFGGSKKEGNFAIVDFNFTNGNKEAVTLDSESFRLIDGKGREFEVDTDTFEYVEPDKDIFLDQVNPGVSKEGEVIFTVAPGASGFTLEAGDTDMFADENAYMDLGF